MKLVARANDESIIFDMKPLFFLAEAISFGSFSEVP
jgi:hypothetical protein